MEKKEAGDIEKVSDEEKEILRIIGEGVELTLREIVDKLGTSDFKKVNKICLSMAKADLVDLLTTGKLVISSKGEKVLRSDQNALQSEDEYILL
ncbi:MAG: hypothetical protein QMC90_03570 [Dehalococcoidales bacterium]|nr:hypothetical protein [Dehalococcoidales bacterium]